MKTRAKAKKLKLASGVSEVRCQSAIATADMPIMIRYFGCTKPEAKPETGISISMAMPPGIIESPDNVAV